MVRRACLLVLVAFGMHAAPMRAAAPLQRGERLRWFHEAKLGVCFHWGLFSVLGEGEWAMSRKKIPPADYAALAEKLKPEDFRAREWVDLARRAGAKYVILMAKHHDGFCLFDSKLTDFTVTRATPLKRDVLRELADECRKQGLKFGVGYSILDWHHPDFLPAPAWDRENPRRAKADAAGYLKYVEGQVRELCGQYGKLDLFWWDGGWHHADETSQKEFTRINTLIRELQPHILINHQANVSEDFGAPEQPASVTGLSDKDGQPIPWEKSLRLTMENNTASPTPAKGQDMIGFRSEEELIHRLVDTVSRGGNLLLHVGPHADGKVPKEVGVSLTGLGRWLTTHGEAVFGTSASPLSHLGFWGRTTRKGNTLYLHAFQWPTDGLFLLPGMSADLVEKGRTKVTLLGSPAVPTALLFRPTPEPLHGVRVIGGAPAAGVSVVKLQFARWPRMAPAPLRPNAEGAVILALMHADIRGERCRLEPTRGGLTLTGWSRREEELHYSFELPVAATYDVVLEYACATADAGGEIAAGVERNEVRGRIQATGLATAFREHTLGRLSLGTGPQTLTLRAVSIPKGKELVRLRSVTLRPAK